MTKKAIIVDAIKEAFPLPDGKHARVKEVNIPEALKNFDVLPDDALVGLRVGGAVIDRSVASIYRDAKAGTLTIIKIGHSSKLRVGDLRRLIGAA